MTAERQDTATEKRVELRCYTNFNGVGMHPQTFALTDPVELVRRAAEWGMDAVAVTDDGVCYAYPNLWEAGKEYGVKIIYGLEIEITDGADGPYTVTLLAKNRTGLKHLYELISLARQVWHHSCLNISESALRERREGLLVGARGASPFCDLFDYIEIRPTDSIEYNREAAAFARDFEKPLVAVSDARFLDPEDEICRRVLRAAKDDEHADEEAPLYFRTTDEMLAAFAWLGEQDCYDAVIGNPRKIAAQCEDIELLPDKTYLPGLVNAAADLKTLVYGRMKELYGDKPPKPIRRRVFAEMGSIHLKGYDSLFMAVINLVRMSRERGYPVTMPFGTLGSSAAAWLAGISDINPFPAHYRCPACGYVEFAEGVHCGASLPDKDCPNCGVPLCKDGFDIPVENFLGIPGNEKAPVLALRVAEDFYMDAHRYLEDTFGAEQVISVGTVHNMSEHMATKQVDEYLEARGLCLPEDERERMIRLCTGVKFAAGESPSGLYILPKDIKITDICPVRDSWENGRRTTRFEARFLDLCLGRIDMVAQYAMSDLCDLENAIGIPTDSVPLDDADTLALLFDPAFWDGLECNPKFRFATLGYGDRLRRMFDLAQPRDFDDLVRLYGFMRSNGAWNDNAETLLAEGNLSLKEVISCREDAFHYLTGRGVERGVAYEIMEAARKGKFRKETLQRHWKEELHRTGPNIWFAESMFRVQYLCPRVQAVTQAMTIYRVAWLAVHAPEKFEEVTYLPLDDAE